MNIILVTRSHGTAKTFSLKGHRLFVLGSLMVGLFVGAYVLGYISAENRQDLLRQQAYIEEWQTDLRKKQQKIARLEHETEERLHDLAIRVAEIHARLIRLDALGEHLIATANIDSEEFDFSLDPAVGGPDEQSAKQQPNVLLSIQTLSEEIAAREQALDVLNSLLGNQDFESDRFISGRPIKRGWLSSRFGKRIDPFTGKIAWHEGIDFAGKDGSDIIAVAAGVVTWAGPRQGYGNLVEINHGGTFATRYAHAKELLVKLGDVVDKGQTVALMGSTGRSTGPHVHFELLKNGNPIDPYRYVKRKPRS